MNIHTFNCVHHMQSHLISTSNPCETSLVYVCGWCNYFVIVAGAIVRTVILYMPGDIMHALLYMYNWNSINKLQI